MDSTSTRDLYSQGVRAGYLHNAMQWLNHMKEILKSGVVDTRDHRNPSDLRQYNIEIRPEGITVLQAYRTDPILEPYDTGFYTSITIPQVELILSDRKVI